MRVYVEQLKWHGSRRRVKVTRINDGKDRGESSRACERDTGNEIYWLNDSVMSLV